MKKIYQKNEFLIFIQVNSCGIYPLKAGIRKTDTGNYLAGSKMTVSCAKYYTFYGNPSYICHPNGTWLPANGVPLHKFKDWPFCERKKIIFFLFLCEKYKTFFFSFNQIITLQH